MLSKVSVFEQGTAFQSSWHFGSYPRDAEVHREKSRVTKAARRYDRDLESRALCPGQVQNRRRGLIPNP